MIDKVELAEACRAANLRHEYSDRILRLAEVKGPFWAVCEAFVGWGHSGLSPFALAGIAGIGPKRVMLRIRRNPNVAMTLGFCSTTLLPIYSPNWSDDLRPLRDYYQMRLDEWLDDYAQTEENEDDYSMERLLKLYGGKDWRKHCTADFNPFEREETVKLEPEQWDLLKRIYRAAGGLR